MTTLYFVGYLALAGIWQICNGQRYLMAGQGVGCSSYPGYEEITTQSQCISAAAALNLDCSSPMVISSNIYPRYCYYNLKGSSCTYRFYFNPDTTGLTIGLSTRFPICKTTLASPPASVPLCALGAGLVATGGSTTPSLTSDLFQCSSTFTFTPYDRKGYMYFQFNPKESGYQWGVQQWRFDVFASGNNYETLWNDAAGDSFYDTVNGVAVDNTNNVAYTILSTKYAATGTSYKHSIVRIDLDSGAGTVLLTDYYPYNCHHLDVTIFRTAMDVDVENQILYWLGTNYDDELALFSLDLATMPYQVKVEYVFDWTVDEQVSQLTVDCNGNVWFSQIFNGVYLYKPGWNDVVLMLAESNLNGIEIIRTKDSVEMTWIIANYFELRQYDSAGIQSGTYSTYPAPPRQARVGSDGDIMHNLQYDVQNDKMSAFTATNDGNYMLFTYDPMGDTNIVWNFAYGPFERQGLGVRYGTYNSSFYTTTNYSFELCDEMDFNSVRYQWIGGTLSTTSCTTAPCIRTGGQSFIRRTFDMTGKENLQIQYDFKQIGFSDTSAMKYNCGAGWVTAMTYANGADSVNEIFNLPTICDNNAEVLIEFECIASLTSEYIYVDNVCMKGEQTGPDSAALWPESLPWTDNLTDYTRSGYWTDYYVQGTAASLSTATSSYCIGTPQCVRFYAAGTSSNATLYFMNFNVKGTEDVVIGYNLAFDADSGAEISNNEGFQVFYSCDGSYPPQWTLIKEYTGVLTSTWGGLDFPDERIALPAECNNIETLSIQFNAYGQSDYHYIDSFIVTTVTPDPSASPTTAPTLQPTTAAPSGNPSVSPTEAPTTALPTASPTDSPTTPSPTSPSVPPSKAPTLTIPTTAGPTVPPTGFPSVSPTTAVPSSSPIGVPSVSPTDGPTTEPTTTGPSASPTTSEPTTVLGTSEEPISTTEAVIVSNTEELTTTTTTSTTETTMQESVDESKARVRGAKNAVFTAVALLFSYVLY